MIEFGKTLREAREARGYSVSQLAEMTRILPQIIENLENEDFSRIVAPIYGRGFVKLYCEQVGIEAQPLIAEFMEIYNGNRPPVIRLRDVEAAPVAEAPAPVAEPPAPAAEEAPAAPEPPPAEPLARPVPPAAPFAPGSDDLPFADERPVPKRDYRLPDRALPDVPRSFWRFGVLAVAAVAVIVLLVLGGRALYRATMRVPAETQGTEPAAKAPRTPMGVPPLYID